MLNRIRDKAIFIMILCVVSYAYPNHNMDSINQDLLKKIAAVKYSDQAIKLNTIITKELNTNINNREYVTEKWIIDLYYEHIKSVLNTHNYEQTFILLDNVNKFPIAKNNHYQWLNLLYRGITFRFQNHLDSAKYYLNRALSMATLSNDSNKIEHTSYEMGLLFYKMKERDAAANYFKTIDSISQDHYMLFDARRRLASTYSIKGSYKLAHKYANGAINSQLSNQSQIIGDEIPGLDGVNKLDILGSAMQTRAYVYRQIANESKDSINMLYYALRDSETSVRAFEMHKRNLFFESDLLEINSMYKYFNTKTIESISRLKRATGADSLNFLALKYAEMDKISALLRTIQKDIALYQSHIPEDTIVYLNNLYAELGEIEARRYKEKANIRLEDEALMDLNLRLYDLVTEIGQIEKGLEEGYPKFKEEKYRIELPDLDFLTDLSSEKAVLEYVMSMDKVYCFLIQDGRVLFHEFANSKHFISKVERLQEIIANGAKLKFTIEEQIEFQNLSSDLYQQLIEPFEKKIDKKTLLIVPDEQLALIPFEILLKSKAETIKGVNYANLDYLVKHYDISYTYSLTLLHMQNNLSKRIRENTLFAMAPGYELAGNTDSTPYYSFRDTQENLSNLKGAKEEVSKVSKRVKGRSLFDSSATEEEFKRNAGKYSVLHLAMHTFVDNDNPLYSKLVFTPNVDKQEDGLLNTYELSNLDLNADLVVLSACNTGFGKVNKGEGIIGLSRGFFQAGCKSLLATLWSVSDEASIGIIDGFYEGLNKNWTKSHSLSESKRTYLSQNKGIWAHPFYWAGYISIGSDEPVKLAKRIFWPYVLAGALLLMIAVWYFRKEKAGRVPGFQSN